MFTSFLRRISKAKEFNEGAKLKLTSYPYLPFKNNYKKLVQMFQLRLYHLNNTPYQFHQRKLGDQLTNLHMELNFLQSRLMIKRALSIFLIIGIYYWVFYEEAPSDWHEAFDIKHDIRAYGRLVDSESEGQFVDD